MLNSAFVVLYNTNNDEVFYCNITDTNSSYIHNNNVKFFEANLKQITNINY